MAYKDILVFLDPTAEAAERARFAASLAKAHGARLIGLDVSAAPAGEEAETEAVIARMFDDATGQAAPAASLRAPAEKAGEGDAFTHCVDLIIAPAPESLRPRQHSARRARPGAARIRRADADPAAGLDRRARSATTSSSPGMAGARRCAPSTTRCRCSRQAQKVTVFASRRGRAICARRPRCWSDHLAAHGVDRAYLGLDQYRRFDRDRGAVRQPRHPGRRSHRRRRLRPFAALRRACSAGSAMDLMHQQSLPVLMSH